MGRKKKNEWWAVWFHLTGEEKMRKEPMMGKTLKDAMTFISDMQNEVISYRVARVLITGDEKDGSMAEKFND